MGRFDTSNLLQFIVTSGLFILITQTLMESVINNILIPLFSDKMETFNNYSNIKIGKDKHIKLGKFILDIIKLSILIVLLFLIVRYINKCH
jgi:large-conductance mechanosensitive channel